MADILILHNVENFSAARLSAADYLFCFERYAPDNNYLYHNINHPATPAIISRNFHAIILDSTALGVVTYRPRELYNTVRQHLWYVREKTCEKIVLPQDDYNHSGILDDLFVWLKATKIYTVLPDHIDVLYPKSIAAGIDIEPTLTGYVDDHRLRETTRFAKPFVERTRLLGQRVTQYPARGGRHGRLKSDLAVIVRDYAIGKRIPVDIEVGDAHAFLGDNWYSFLGDCKYVLGNEGGTSLLDVDGSLMDAIDTFVANHPNATFEEIEGACFPGQDMRRIFSAVSPRLFEAAMCGCCQILVPGHYLNVLKPYEHYIPLAADGSNLDEVFELMQDTESAQRRIEATYRALVENREFRYSTFVSRVMAHIRQKRAMLAASLDKDAFEALRCQHWSQLADLLYEREFSVGFEDSALVERVRMFMQNQLAEIHTVPGSAVRLREMVGILVAEKAARLGLRTALEPSTPNPAGDKLGGATFGNGLSSENQDHLAEAVEFLTHSAKKNSLTWRTITGLLKARRKLKRASE